MKKIILTFIGLGFILTTHAQHGVDLNWGNEVLLPITNPANKQRGVLYNNIVTTSTGRIIISTTEVNSSNINVPLGHYLTYSDDGGNTWTPPNTFLPPTLVIGGGGVKLAMDTDDTLFVLWSSVNPSAIFMSILDKDLTVIKDTIRVANKQTYGNFATHFSIDRYNRVHVMWHEGNPGASNIAECFYTRSTNGGYTWDTVQPLSNNDGRHSAFPHAEFDVAGDTLCIAWRDSVVAVNWDVYGVFSTDGGISWNSPQSIESTNNAEWDPDLVIDNQGRIHLFFHVYPQSNPFNAYVKYKYSDDVGLSWQLPNAPPTGQLSQTVRSQLVEGCRYDVQNNVLWLTWKDEADYLHKDTARSDMMAAYSLDRGLTWSSPEYVTDRYDSTLAFKAGALLPTGEFCVNYEIMSPGNINDPSGFLRVYFRKRQPVTTSVNEFTITDNNFIIYPNPTNNNTVIQFNQMPTTPVSIRIYNYQGQVLQTIENVSKQTVQIETENLSSGLYFVQVQADRQVIGTGKLIISD